MRKIYHLSTCDTNRRIIKTLGGLKDFDWQDIKFESITPGQLKEMSDKAGSYEALFSRRALKYKELNLKDKELKEADYKKLILQEYTFLKRPVIIVGEDIFIGNATQTIEAAKKMIKGEK